MYCIDGYVVVLAVGGVDVVVDVVVDGIVGCGNWYNQWSNEG